VRIEGYEVTELAPGVKQYVKKGGDHTTVAVGMPWVHIHYPMGDTEADALGHTEAELCCHGCHGALWVTLDWPLSENAAKPVLDDFKARHAECWDNHRSSGQIEDAIAAALAARGEHPMQSMCPIERSSIHAVDLRGKVL
jgi:hypothetical protein